MALKETRIVKYELENPAFADVEFTESSKNYRILPKAVQFAMGQKAVLQSAREAAAFRIEADKADGADLCQATRTGSIYFIKDGKKYIAVDDHPDPNQNIVISRVQEGYNANRVSPFSELFVPLNDEQLNELLNRAEKADRIHQFPSKCLELALEDVNGSSEFGKNSIARSLLGDMVEPYATFLRGRKCKTGYVFLLDPNYVEAQTKGQTAIVRPAGLGGGSYIDIGSFGTGNQFGNGGGVRGVRGAREWPEVPEDKRTYKLVFQDNETFEVHRVRSAV